MFETAKTVFIKLEECVLHTIPTNYLAYTGKMVKETTRLVSVQNIL